jgi:hypothetical protein
VRIRERVSYTDLTVTDAMGVTACNPAKTRFSSDIISIRLGSCTTEEAKGMEKRVNEHKVAFAILSTALALVLYVAQQLVQPYLGVDRVSVPDVLGKDRVQATILLQNRGLEVVYDPNNPSQSDHVWRQAPEGTRLAKRGDKVTLFFTPRPNPELHQPSRTGIVRDQTLSGQRIDFPPTHPHPTTASESSPELSASRNILLISHDSRWSRAEWSVNGLRRPRGDRSSPNVTIFYVVPGLYRIKALLPDVPPCEVEVPVNTRDRIKVNLQCP